jgi:hypothetical protein
MSPKWHENCLSLLVGSEVYTCIVNTGANTLTQKPVHINMLL